MSMWSRIVAVAVLSASPASALVAGGEAKKTDCYAEWRVTTREQGPTKCPKNRCSTPVPDPSRRSVACQDGDSACDADGLQNSSCTMGVSICAFQTDTTLTSCTPAPVTAIDKLSVKVRPASLASSIAVTAPVPPATPVAAPDCGTATVFTLPLRKDKKGRDIPSAKVKFKMRAAAGKKDRDALTVSCVPGQVLCGPNPEGGPRQLDLTIVPTADGGDLDNGWNGISHNFPIVGNALLSFCLTGCDASANPSCTGSGKTGKNTANGVAFGAPLPLLTSNTPVCVVNRFDPAGPDGQTGTADDNTIGAIANHATGDVDAKVHLLSDVYITINTPTNGKGQVCPQCSGAALGSFGTCIGGATPGGACKVDGAGFVADSTGNKDYKLSSACRPTGTPVATLKIALDPLRTGTTMGGSCSGQANDDNCAGGTCNAACSGAACDSLVADPTNPGGPQVCKDRKGGISQLCCSNRTDLPCYPTRGGGQITRTGRAVAPTPDGAGAAFPASSLAVLTSVFCEPKTNNSVLDVTTTGLPGPGALIQPMDAKWLP